MAPTPAGRIWDDYIAAFDAFASDGLRPGCEPRILDGPRDDAPAIVLVHGLTDSPWFMNPLARVFNERLGYRVYLPLLHMHGLREPAGMEGVALEEWKRNVRFAVRAAADTAPSVSIGGLSTGGALSLHAAIVDPDVSGDLYLFSAALRLRSRIPRIGGRLKEWLLGTPVPGLVEWLRGDDGGPLIGDNPYRYSRMDFDGAVELARLIGELDALLEDRDADHRLPLRTPVFAAHSEADATADIAGIEALARRIAAPAFEFHRIAAAAGVPHASLVLDAPVYAADGRELEPANAHFDGLAAAIVAFAR